MSLWACFVSDINAVLLERSSQHVERDGYFVRFLLATDLFFNEGKTTCEAPSDARLRST